MVNDIILDLDFEIGLKGLRIKLLMSGLAVSCVRWAYKAYDVRTQSTSMCLVNHRVRWTYR